MLTSCYDRFKTRGKLNVNVRRYNKIVMRRKLRLASYVSAPRLIRIRRFQNNPHIAA